MLRIDKTNEKLLERISNKYRYVNAVICIQMIRHKSFHSARSFVL